ncbi:hypothetical protein [Paraburkholderia domus]|uniref:hypothetical protein n=1 Tax=Paraburkholderia domus TaxID=2793075 RepID=UPI001B8C28D7|nr:hypothetical protein [Paraburkholderia domus]
MREQQPTGVSAETVEGARPVRRRTVGVMQYAALIDACSHFVAQLDAHPAGAAIFLCIIALAAGCWLLAAGCVVVVALAVTRASHRLRAGARRQELHHALTRLFER